MCSAKYLKKAKSLKDNVLLSEKKDSDMERNDGVHKWCQALEKLTSTIRKINEGKVNFVGRVLEVR